ncbi:MAG: DUF1816 domain-containing protein [Anaerolineae bacterium]|nr:DUF1816 domain-containing protein [Gloeobacterales cyanobacterium ES-bin-313]
MEKQAVRALCTEEGGWWLEVVTDEPYLYLFGPFETTEEADYKSNDYFKDLASEGWKIISSKMTQSAVISNREIFESLENRLE